MPQGFYEMLGVDTEAPPEKIRAAYQRRLAELVRRLRGARKQGADVSILEAQERELREAMDVLADPARRRRYDAFRRAVEDELPVDAETLWDRARWSLVDPVAPLAVAVLRALTDLPVGDPLPDPMLRPARPPAAVAAPAPVVPLPAPRVPLPPLPRPVARPVAIALEPETDEPAPAAVGAAPRVGAASDDAADRPSTIEGRPAVAIGRISPRESDLDAPSLPSLPPPARSVPLAPRPATAPLGPAESEVDDWLHDDESDEDLLPSTSGVPAPAAARVPARPAAAGARAWLSGVLGNVTGRAEQSRVEPVELDEDDELSAEVERPSGLRVLSPAPDEPGLDEIGRIARRHGLGGRFLKEVRQLRELSLEDLVRTTRISSRFLSAIEEDDYERLPNATFVRGYLKQVAEALGVADRGVVEGFMAQYKEHRG